MWMSQALQQSQTQCLELQAEVDALQNQLDAGQQQGKQGSSHPPTAAHAGTGPPQDSICQVQFDL